MSNKHGPIVIVEDDPDDCEILESVFATLQIANTLLFFPNGKTALSYLQTTTDQPFLIISDVNLPLMNGLELRRAINADPHLRRKSIPFIFLTTSIDPVAVHEAYEMMVQGYFKKPMDLLSLEQTIRMVYDYWQICRHPNSL